MSAVIAADGHQATELAPSGQASLLNIIARAAENKDVDVAKLSALLDMQDRVMARDAEREFNAAMLAIGQIKVSKRGTIQLGQGKGSIPFATWEDMDAALRPLMEEHGFSLSFDSAPRMGDGGGLVVTAKLLHRGGHSQTASMPLALDAGPGRNAVQAMGSSLSYGKRYTTEMLFNVIRTGEDDDGQRGGTKTITVEQGIEIERLIAEVGADKDRWLKHMGVDGIMDIPATQYTAAVNTLNTKRKKAGI